MIVRYFFSFLIKKQTCSKRIIAPSTTNKTLTIDPLQVYRAINSLTNKHSLLTLFVYQQTN